MNEKNELNGFEKYIGYVDTIIKEAEKQSLFKDKVFVMPYYQKNFLHCFIDGLNVYYDKKGKEVFVSRKKLFDRFGNKNEEVYMNITMNKKNENQYCKLACKDVCNIDNSSLFYIEYSKEPLTEETVALLPLRSDLYCKPQRFINTNKDMEELLNTAIKAAYTEKYKAKYGEAINLIDSIRTVTKKIDDNENSLYKRERNRRRSKTTDNSRKKAEHRTNRGLIGNLFPWMRKNKKVKFEKGSVKQEPNSDRTQPKNPWVVTNPNTIEEKNSMNNKTGENGFEKYSGYIDAIIKKAERKKLFNDDDVYYGFDYNFQHCVIDGINIYYKKEDGFVLISEDELSDEHIFADDGKIILQRYYDDIDYNAKICCLTYRYSKFCFTIGYVQGKDEAIIKIVNGFEESSYPVRCYNINSFNMNEVLNEFMNISMDERISIDKKEFFSNNAKKLIDAICKIAKKEIETER